MTDEEMAEEIANKRCHEIMCYGHCSFNSPKHHRCGEWHREYNCALEGLKAGRQPMEEAVEIIRELGGIVREGVTCHYLTDCGVILHRATLFLKEANK